MENDTTTRTVSSKNRRRNLIILIGVIIVIIILIGAFLINKRKAETSVAPLPTEVSVELNDEGFDPPEVTIKQGSAVRWTHNSSDEQVSINSDDHPTNQKYPELNLGEFQKGSSVVHIFKTPGTYTYHDYFHPERRGTVIVE